MNRILCFLESPAVRRQRRKELLNAEMEAIDKLAGNVLWLSLDFIDDDDEPAICWRIADHRQDNTFHMPFNKDEAIAELRAFAAECLSAATKLEEGAK